MEQWPTVAQLATLAATLRNITTSDAKAVELAAKLWADRYWFIESQKDGIHEHIAKKQGP